MYQEIFNELTQISTKKGDFPYLIKEALNKVQIKRAKDIAQIWLKDLQKIKEDNKVISISIQKKINLAKKVLELN